MYFNYIQDLSPWERKLIERENGPVEQGAPVDLLIANGTIYGPDSAQVADLAIDNGKVVGIHGRGAAAPRARRSIDAKGLAVLPGLIHTHCHFREPGHTY